MSLLTDSSSWRVSFAILATQPQTNFTADNATMDQNTQKCIDIAKSATEEFFTSVGVTLRSEQTSPIAVKAAEIYTASLGFSGDKIKGALVVTTYAEAIAATNPQREYMTTFTQEDHTDWIGEMANQIVGNIKRMLAKFDLNFTLGTPVVVTGSGLQLMSKEQAKFNMFEMMADVHKIKFHLAVELSKDVDLSVSEKDDKTAGGGESFLF